MPYAKTERRIEYRRVSYWERRRRCDELGVCFECGKVPPVEGRLRCVACARANKVRVIRAQMKRSRAIAIGERNDRLPPVFPDDTPEELERIIYRCITVPSYGLPELKTDLEAFIAKA